MPIYASSGRLGHIRAIFDDPNKPISIGLDPTIEAVQLPFATTAFIISELINNALDALKAEPDGQITLAIRKDRKSIAIEVEDTGVGMSGSVADNCLSPFFTTKPESSGHCGFGLHSIARLISGLDGQLDISSQESVGTRISITIPRGAV